MKNISTARCIIGGVIVLLCIALYFASSIIRSYVEKNSIELIGRKLTLSELHINYATISVNAKDLVLYEDNELDTFVSFSHFYLNFQPWKLLAKEYALSALEFDSLYVNVEQEGDVFNFSSLMPVSDSIVVDTVIEENDSEVRFSISNINFSNGRIKYLDKEIDNCLDFKKLNLILPHIAWDNKQSNVGASFTLGDNGKLAITANINHEVDSYEFGIQVDSLGLTSFSNYLKPYMNIANMGGYMDMNMLVRGSVSEVTNIVVSGDTEVSDFFFEDQNGEKIVAVNTFVATFDSLDIDNQFFYLSRVELTHPMISAKLNPESTNWEEFLAPLFVEDSILVADSTAVETEIDSILVRYQIDTIQINKGTLLFEDNTLSRTFSYEIAPMNVLLSDLTESATSVPVTFDMTLNKKGIFKGKTTFNMLDPYQVWFKGLLNDLELMSFSPYTEYYIGRPITQGAFDYECLFEMTGEQMKNENRIFINKLDFGKKIKTKSEFSVPIRLALYILKDKDDNISIDLPVWGNPSDPEFKVGEIVWKTVSNFLIKTATQPFGALAGMVGADPESIKYVPFEYTQDTLSAKQQGILDNLIAISEQKSDLRFNLIQETLPQIEKSRLAVKQAAIKYLYHVDMPETLDDSTKMQDRWELVNTKSDGFKNYMASNVTTTDTMTFEQQCIALIGEKTLNNKLLELMSNRNSSVKAYIKNMANVDTTAFVISVADMKNIHDQVEQAAFRVEVSMQ